MKAEKITLVGAEAKAPTVDANNNNEDNYVFDVKTATLEQLKDFVQGDAELDEIVDLKGAEETIRSTVKAYLDNI